MAARFRQPQININAMRIVRRDGGWASVILSNNDNQRCVLSYSTASVAPSPFTNPWNRFSATARASSMVRGVAGREPAMNQVSDAQLRCAGRKSLPPLLGGVLEDFVEL